MDYVAAPGLYGWCHGPSCRPEIAGVSVSLWRPQGVNDGGASFPYREESREEFFKFFDEPADSPRRDQKGVYTDRWYRPSPGRSVHVILLDNRFNKDEYGEPDGDFLGEEQWRWFEAAVRQNASLTIIGSGLQILVDDRFGFGITQRVGENWARFPAARARLLAAVRTSPAPTLLLSGDIHFAELNEASYSPGGKHKVVELTSSSMTHSAARIFPNLPVGASVRWAIYRLMSLWSIVMPWKYRVETCEGRVLSGLGAAPFNNLAEPSSLEPFASAPVHRCIAALLRMASVCAKFESARIPGGENPLAWPPRKREGGGGGMLGVGLITPPTASKLHCCDAFSPGPQMCTTSTLGS